MAGTIKTEFTVGELLKISIALRRDEHTYAAAIREPKDEEDKATNRSLLKEAERCRELAVKVERLFCR